MVWKTVPKPEGVMAAETMQVTATTTAISFMFPLVVCLRKMSQRLLARNLYQQLRDKPFWYWHPRAKVL
ncbi:unnamed protein product, partial [Nezara viridula]